MKITLQTVPGNHLIRSFAPGELKIGEQIVYTSCLVTADSLTPDWGPPSLASLAREHLEPIIAWQPEIVLLGTGTKQRFPERGILTALLKRRIGVEVMDTAAAARTFNVLVAEDRRVLAALLLKDD